MTYEQWMMAVSAIVIKACGLSIDELPDWLSRDAFEDELSPEEGAELCLEEAGFYEYIDADDSDDGEALASAGWGTDEDYE